MKHQEIYEGFRGALELELERLSKSSTPLEFERVRSIVFRTCDKMLMFSFDLDEAKEERAYRELFKETMNRYEPIAGEFWKSYSRRVRQNVKRRGD